MFLCTLLFVLSLLVGGQTTSTVITATAMKFDRWSGIREIGPRSVDDFFKTPKPVFVLFYAPWCGHCKTLQPKWESFAKSMKHIVRVGVVDGENLKNFAAMAGVTGFPNIKYWPMGKDKKTITNGRPFEKAHETEDLRRFARTLISWDKIDQLSVLPGRGGPNDPQKTAEEILSIIEERAQDASTGKVVVWLTSPQLYAQHPPFWPVMAWDESFDKKISFVTLFIHPRSFEDPEQKYLLKRLKFTEMRPDIEPMRVNFFRIYNDDLEELSAFQPGAGNQGQKEPSKEVAVNVGRWLHEDGLGTKIQKSKK